MSWAEAIDVHRNYGFDRTLRRAEFVYEIAGR
jgi:hypothetical protein